MKVSRIEFAQIKAEAVNLGFFEISAIPSGQPSHFSLYRQWLDKYLYGDMHYLARSDAVEKRSDPSLLLPECRSILCLTFPYPTTVSKSTTPATVGRISGYAIFPDYHQLIAALLEQLVRFIKKQLGRSFSYRCCVDSSPILEKDFAAAAGLGWIGKNSCLISPQIGSSFFLAEILTDLSFDYGSTLMPDRCGNCTRCIDACPAQCILPGRTLAANRCISYLTIEHKSVIPVELRSTIGQWVFGCDICQLVCPWNNQLLKTERSFLLQSKKNINNRVNLYSELLLTENDFKKKYLNFPIYRLGRNRFLRNIAIALGNQKTPSNFDLIDDTLEHEKDALVRTHLYWALAESDHAKAGKRLQRFLKSETTPIALSEIHLAIKKINRARS